MMFSKLLTCAKVLLYENELPSKQQLTICLDVFMNMSSALEVVFYFFVAFWKYSISPVIHVYVAVIWKTIIF